MRFANARSRYDSAKLQVSAPSRTANETRRDRLGGVHHEAQLDPLGQRAGFVQARENDRECPRDVVHACAGEHFRLDGGCDREPVGAVLELEPAELHAFVSLGMRPELHSQPLRALSHVLHISLHYVEMEQQGGRLEIVLIHLSPFPLLPSPFPASSHHVELGLTTQNPAHLPVRTELGVFFLS